MTSFERSWLEVPIIAAAWAALLIWGIRGRAVNKGLAWPGAVLFGAGSGLLIPALNGHNRTPLIVAAAITMAVGALLYVCALIMRRV